MRNSVCSNGGRLIGCDHSSRGGQRNSDPKIEMRNVGLLLPLSRTMQKMLLATAVSLCMALRPATAADLEPLRYNNPGLVVDLGVGLWAWPIPMDFDSDGDNDLIVSCPDIPYNGTYFFENTAGAKTLPVLESAVRIGDGYKNIRVSFVNGEPRVLTPAREFRDFRERRFTDEVSLSLPANVHTRGHRIRANQWHYVDFDADEILDIVIGVGDWHDYGWDDAWNERGEWTNGPLRGFVYLAHNAGTNHAPHYETPVRLTAQGKVIETFGWPSPNFADFDGDGDLDLLCGEFLDKFMYFENVGSATEPWYTAGRQLMHEGRPLQMDLQMIVPSAIDWDQDGDIDLIVGDEDGRVALVQHTGKIENGMPRFLPPQYFRQQADLLKFGALATPYCHDWDDDGDQDILCGNTAGYIGLFENLGGSPVRWAAPELLRADGQPIRIQAGPNGSIQGPCEAKWGYTTISVADWDHDGRPDVIANSIWGRVVWYRNTGTRTSPELQAVRPITVDWPSATPKPAWTWWGPEGKQLVTQWRTTPQVVDWNGDGLNDLVMLDHEGYLALFPRSRSGSTFRLLPGQRIFVDETGALHRLNARVAGKSGRRKIHVVDWDGDGRLDLLVNSENSDFYRNLAAHNGRVVLSNTGPIAKRNVSGHTSSPTSCDFNSNSVPDLLVGGEDGHLYYLTR